MPMNRNPHVVYGKSYFVLGKRCIEVRKTVRRVRKTVRRTHENGRVQTGDSLPVRRSGTCSSGATLRAARWHGSNVRAQAASLPSFGHAGANPARP